MDGVFNSRKIWVKKSSPINSKYIPVHKGYEKRTIMVWGAICSRGIVHLERLKSTLNTNKYVSILKGDFIKAARVMYNGCNFILVQDNAPPHTSIKAQEFFDHSGIFAMNIPPNSPNLNAIENIWSILASGVYADGRRFTDKGVLWKIIEKEWKGLEPQLIAKTCGNWDDRLSEVLEQEGKATKY